MKHHNGIRRVNKLDGGKKLAKKQFHKGLREAGKKLIDPLDSLIARVNRVNEQAKQILVAAAVDPDWSLAKARAFSKKMTKKLGKK